MVGRGPGADQVQSLLAAAARATQRLAVDGDLIKPQSVVQGLHPFAEASLESLRIELIEHALEGVMSRRLLRQPQEPRQPVAATAGKGFDLLPVVTAADDTTDRHDDKV